MEPTTTTILLILLGTVSGILILILVIIGIKVWNILSSLQKITRLFSDEADQMKHILKKVRTKIHSMME